MKSSTRDKAEGTFHEVKGKIKESAGKLANNQKLETAGMEEQLVGAVQKKVGEIKGVLGS